MLWQSQQLGGQGTTSNRFQMAIFLGSLTQPVIPWNTGWLRTGFPRQWIMIAPNISNHRKNYQPFFFCTAQWVSSSALRNDTKGGCSNLKNNFQVILKDSRCLLKFSSFISIIHWDPLPFPVGLSFPLAAENAKLPVKCAILAHGSRGAVGTMGCRIV